MDLKVVIDWKFVVALGGSALAIIFATKLDCKSVKEVSTYAVDAYKDYAIYKLNNR